MNVAVAIPSFNEADAIGYVVRAVPGDRAESIFVVDNDFTDDTAVRGTLASAWVIHEFYRRYLSAYLDGVKAARDSYINVFLDGDRSAARQLDAIATFGEAKNPYS